MSRLFRPYAQRIAITNSNSQLSQLIATQLSGKNPLVLLTLEPNEAPQYPNSEIRKCHYNNNANVSTALQGCHTVFMTAAKSGLSRAQENQSFISGAVTSGIRHLVYLSLANADSDSLSTVARSHAETEALIQNSGIPYTIVRSNFFSELIPALSDARGNIFGPVADGRVACVNRSDVAEAIANILRTPSAHTNHIYTLTGPEAVSFEEGAKIMSEVLGIPYQYHHQTINEAYNSRARFKLPKWRTDAWISTYTSIANGELAKVSDDLPKLLGRPSKTFRETLSRNGG